MPWFRIDDSFYDHPKVKALPKRDRAPAVGLWALAGAWSSKHLTDGKLPRAGVAEFAPVRLADALGKCGLWEYDDADGFVFHDWLEIQPSRVQVEERRLADRQRQQRGRAKQQRPRNVTP